jgi:hypothetical protein
VSVRAQDLHDAVRAGDLAKVKALVAEHPRVVNEKDARGRRPLHCAAAAGLVDLMDRLVKDGFRVDGPEILSWQSSVKNITYVFGWRTGLGGRTIDLAAPRAEEGPTQGIDGVVGESRTHFALFVLWSIR